MESEEKSLIWYYFYNFILIPFIIFLYIKSIFIESNYFNILFLCIIFIPLIVMKTIVFIYMILKKEKTLTLLKFSIYMGTIIYVIGCLNIIIKAVNITNIVVLLIIVAYALLNVSYFEDRKDIFKN